MSDRLTTTAERETPPRTACADGAQSGPAVRSMELLADWEFRKDLDRLVANAVCEALTKRLPIKAVEAGWICRAHAVNHRFDVTRCGQDSSDSRLNLFTDGKGNVTRMVIG